MKKNKILVTGGTGRLAFELKKHLDAEYVGIEHFDFTYSDEIPDKKYDLIVHMGAYTDVAKAETEAAKCMTTNVMGTFNLVQKYKDTPFIYISTEWAYEEKGIYALSKRIGEEIVASQCKNYKILRTLFKPYPWPFEYAYEDQWTQGDYVNIIAFELSKIIKTWDRKTKNRWVYEFLGTGRKTILELARRTKPEVKANKVEDWNKKLGRDIVPHDYR